jgi:hypothetical protein
MSTSDSQELIQDLAKDLARCRQNRLLSEGEFIRFCKKEKFLFRELLQGIPAYFKIADYYERTQGEKMVLHCITLLDFILYM